MSRSAPDVSDIPTLRAIAHLYDLAADHILERSRDGALQALEKAERARLAWEAGERAKSG